MKLRIKQLFMKIKQKIKNWLFVDELRDIQQLKEKYEHMIKAYEHSERLLTEARREHMKAREITVECQKFMNSICDVGTDVGLYNDHSWAVVCIHGKADYVKFVDMSREDIMTVARFLKQFEYSNRVTDSPIGYKQFFEDMIVKF